jgi:hypothetical protein
MKNKLKSFIILLFGTLALQSCGGDDEKTPADVLVTSHRQTGVFYKINVATGATTEIFTPTYDGDTFKEVRAFVYHPGENLFYASRTTFLDQNSETPRVGYLFTLNPKTKEATLINNNDGDGGSYAVWDAIVNWAVADDDSLVSVGDFNGDGNGIVKFGTDGGRSLKTKEVDICCGMGILYDKESGTLLVGSGENSDDAQIIIETISAEGEVTNTSTITALTDFPDDLTADWLTLKAMAKDKKGNVYGIVFNDELSKSYFVSIDLEGEEITYISTLGADNGHQFNTLAFIPAKYAK